MKGINKLAVLLGIVFWTLMAFGSVLYLKSKAQATMSEINKPMIENFGEIALQHPLQRQFEVSRKRVTLTGDQWSALSQISHIKSISPRLSGGGLLVEGMASRSVTYIGIDTGREGQHGVLSKLKIEEGDASDGLENNNLLLDQKSASLLGLKANQLVEVYLADAEGDYSGQIFRVKAIFSQSDESEPIVYLPVKTVQGMLGLGATEFLRISLFLDSNTKVEDVRDEIVTKLNLPPDIMAFTWFDQNSQKSDLVSFQLIKSWLGLSLVALLVMLILQSVFLVAISRR